MDRSIMKGKLSCNAKREKTVQERKPSGRGRASQRAHMAAGAIVGAVILIGAMVAPLCAQTYPNKPIRFIIPVATGGSADLMGRLVALKLGEQLGQPLVVENRGGAGGNISYGLVAKAQPDGYNLVLCGATVATSPTYQPSVVTYAIKDFAAVTPTGQMPYLLVIRPELPINSLKELVAYAKANPGKLNYGSSGTGNTTHLAFELLNSIAKIKTVHVAYKSGGQIIVAMLGGEVDMQVIGTPSAMPQIQAGKLRVLAVLDQERAPLLPNVPTAKEAGIDNFEVTSWYGILAPAGTPRDIVNRLNSAWKNAVAMPDTKEQMQRYGFVPLTSTPEQYSEFLKSETVRWAKVIKEARIPTR